MCTFCTLCTLCTLCTFPEIVVHFRNYIESSCALGYAKCRNKGRQASFQYSFTRPYIWMCAQKAGSNTLETCSWDRGWVLWKSAQRVHKVQKVHEVQPASSLMYSTAPIYIWAASKHQTTVFGRNGISMARRAVNHPE